MKYSVGAEVITPQVMLDTNLEIYPKINSICKCYILESKGVRIFRRDVMQNSGFFPQQIYKLLRFFL